MSSTLLFGLIVLIVCIDFIIEQILDYLNAKRFNSPIPAVVQDVYNTEDYQKSQSYKKARYRFGWISATCSFLIMLTFLFLDGFAYVDEFARSVSSNNLVISLLFFGIIMLGLDLLMLPFAYYSTFVIETAYGFNKTTKKLFFADKVKGWLLGSIIGGILLSLILLSYQKFPDTFWIYAWAIVTLFSLIMNMFYAKLIVPLFNKQTPLAPGTLRDKIAAYAKSVGFELENIYIIDGSKRSTKANAYFSGFGKEKRITLYDTLIQDLNEDEIVAVLAHEVGHYKKHHVLYNLFFSVITTGITLWLFSLLVSSDTLAQALGVEKASFHIGLIAFGMLYSPISEITGLLMNSLSRKFEYQADAYAKQTYNATDLINALKKLSKNSLSNLTPHPLYVWFNYSHPSLVQRIRQLNKAPKH